MVPIEKCWKRKYRGQTWRVMIGRNPILGFWCGYVAIPKLALKTEKEGVAPPDECTVCTLEEITFCQMVDGMGRVIGFDTGNAGDRMRPPTEKEMSRRANRFADQIAQYYCDAALWQALRQMENEARKFAMRKTEAEAENHDERRVAEAR